jgi:hypothetical protein
MLKKTIGVLALASLTLIAAPPVLATTATLESASVEPADGASTSVTNDDYLGPAMWAWGSTGVVGLGVMVIIGGAMAHPRRKTDPVASEKLQAPSGQYA